MTEKGYCLAGDGTLDFAHPDIVHDLARAGARRVSLVGWLALGPRRPARGRAGAVRDPVLRQYGGNGKKLRAAVLAFAERLDPELAALDRRRGAAFPIRWSIRSRPRPTTRCAAGSAKRPAFDDAIPVAREAYAAWVIEDVLPAGRPGSGRGRRGPDRRTSARCERAKLRILNGAHSSARLYRPAARPRDGRRTRWPIRRWPASSSG